VSRTVWTQTGQRRNVRVPPSVSAAKPACSTTAFRAGVAERACLSLMSVLAGQALRVGIRRAARDRVALVVLGVVDLLAVDRDAAVLVVDEP